MKIFRVAAVMFCLCLMLVVNAHAQAASPWYGGVKIGLVDLDDGAGFSVDEPINLGLMVGHDLHHLFPGFSVEGELTTSLADGDVSVPFFGKVGDLSVTTLAVYGVYKSVGELYFKGKAGLALTDADIGAFGSEDDLNLSFGIGGGWTVSEKGSLEVEFTFLEITDATYLSFGYVHRFQ